MIAGSNDWYVVALCVGRAGWWGTHPPPQTLVLQAVLEVTPAQQLVDHAASSRCTFPLFPCVAFRSCGGFLVDEGCLPVGEG
jgi:hypothetical protein